MRSGGLVVSLLVLSLSGAACDSGSVPSVVGDDPSDDPSDSDDPGAIDAGVVVDAAPPPDAAPPRVRFIAVGDTGEGNEDQRKVAIAMRDVCAARGCDFVLLLGDNIYDSGVSALDDPQWQAKFEEPYHDVDLPFYAVLGNHDYGGSLLIPIPGLGNEWDKGMFEVNYTAHSEKWIMPDHHYTFTQGHVGFIVLDTNSLMWNDMTYGDQRTWFPSALSEVQDSRWIFVAGHHPYRSNGSHGNAGNYDTPEGIPNPLPVLNGAALKSYFDEVVCGTGHLYFSGHDHSRQWIDMPDQLCGTQMIVSGAGSKVSSIQDRANTMLFEDASEPGFMWADVNGDSFTGVFYDATGNLDYERTITRPE